MTYVTASDGVRLHYEAIGGRDKPVVLLIQGLGADKHGWDLQRWSLAGTHRTIAFDNRGVGRSDKPEGSYSLEQMAADAIAVLDHAGVETAHVVGASMGGAISQIVAVKYPHRVRSLTLACTSCRNHVWRQELLSSWVTIAAEQGMGAMSAQAARWVIEPRSFRRILPALGWLGPLGTRRAAHGFAGQVNAIVSVDADVANELCNLTMPTLVIVGNQDILTPRGDSEELAELIPNAELVVISGAAHGLMIEHAATFNTILKDFLRSVETARELATAGMRSASRSR
jgi:3-oxoadipate enol-lactonase